jgi:hypothetical protein
MLIPTDLEDLSHLPKCPLAPQDPVGNQGGSLRCGEAYGS